MLDAVTRVGQQGPYHPGCHKCDSAKQAWLHQLLPKLQAFDVFPYV